MTATTTRPAYPDVMVDNLPSDLTASERFVAWRYEWRDGKWTKVPINPRTGRRAESNDPETWATLTEAHGYASRYGLGAGRMFAAQDGIAGVDLDDCRDPETGAIAPWALAIVEAFSTYTEISPSETGLKLWGYGRMPDGKGHKGAVIEMYDSGRYFTLTGNVLPGYDQLRDVQAALVTLYRKTFDTTPPAASSPRPAATLNLDDREVIERASRAANGMKFDRLMRGDTGDYAGDESAADLALCSILSFWTQDPEQISRIVATSGLYRPKWEREDYRRRTIDKALQRSDYYDPGRQTPPPPAPAVTRAAESDIAGETCGAERARITELEQLLADERAARIAAEAERDAARADVEQLRQHARRFARIMANPKMAEGAKLMLMALIPEIESIRSGAGAPLDPKHRDPRVSGKAFHVNRAAMGERLGCSEDTAGDRIDKLVKAGLFTKRYRPKGQRDPETGKLLQGDGGKEMLLEPIAEDLDILLAEATIAETPGRANQGGKRTPKRCPDHPDARLRRRRTDVYVCEDCGQITDEVTSETTVDPNRQVDGWGTDTPVSPRVAHNVLRYVKQPVGVEPEANRQIDGSRYVPQEPAWVAAAMED